MVPVLRPPLFGYLMFVTNHVLSGVVIGLCLRERPVAAFAAGVGSHLLLDALPHWGCDWNAPDANDRFLTAAIRDGLLGLATCCIATVAVDEEAWKSTLSAISGAVCLDLDKPSRVLLGWNPFPGPIQRLHNRVQNETARGL